MSEFSTHFFSKPADEIHLKLRKSTLIAISISLILHLILFYFLHPTIQLESSEIRRNQPLSVRLASPSLPPSPIIPSEPEVVIKPEPVKPNQPKQRKTTRSEDRKVIAIPKSEQIPDWMVPTPTQTPNQAPTEAPSVKPDTKLPKSNPSPDAPTDMASYVAAQRAKRAAAQGVSPDIWQDAPAEKMSESDRRDAIIQRNLQMGVNGLFQIVNMSEQHAQFTFKGWTNSISSAKQELIQVEAQPGEDIHLAVVKRMISLIRRYHQKDFNWESQRLGKVIVLSARQEDNAGLEAFLMQEFFSEAGKRFN